MPETEKAILKGENKYKHFNCVVNGKLLCSLQVFNKIELYKSFKIKRP